MASVTGALATSERLAMNGDSEQSEIVRLYFGKLREFITEHQHLFYQSLTNHDELKKYRGRETIYFFVADERYPDIIKYGRSIDIVDRLRVYNVGRIKEVELKYLSVVKNSILVENCIKLNTEKNRVFENKELIKISMVQLKKIIDKCHCKYISMEQNDNLYDEISQIHGLYVYMKDKVNMKPYMIIGSELFGQP